jgi:putative ABC transport system permease protein
VLLAWRNLSRDRTRFALSVAGVAVSIMLILVLRGYLDGTYQQASAYFDETPGELVIAQSGTRSGISGSSVLPAGTEERVRTTAGVTGVIPILMQNAILDVHGRKQFSLAIGFKPGSGGGPWRLASGREPQAADEVTLDRLFANEHDIALGDRIEVLGQELKVVGTSDGTSFWIGTYAFMTKDGLAGLTRSPDATSFLFVSLEAGVSTEEARVTLAALDGVNVLTKAQIVENQRRVIGRIYDAPLGLMVGIAFAVGVLVVGLVIYAATVERRREYGVLKAVGGSNGVLYRVVALQALIASTLGALSGVALGYGVSALLMAIRPQFNIAIEPGVVAVALGASLLMALLAALIPSRAMARLAPSEVMRS